MMDSGGKKSGPGILAIDIVSKRLAKEKGSKAEDETEDESGEAEDVGLETAAADLIAGVKDNDTGAVIAALKAAFKQMR